MDADRETSCTHLGTEINRKQNGNQNETKIKDIFLSARLISKIHIINLFKL